MTPMIRPTARASPRPLHIASEVHAGRGGYSQSDRVGRFRQHCRDGRAWQARPGSAGRRGRPTPPSSPHDLARPGALRGPVREADAGDALLRNARPDGDHRAARGDLARRWPARHLDLPAESFAAQMTRIAHESSAEALQYGPTEGFEETKACIAEVMAAEGMTPDPDDLIVTTGPAGDRPDRQDAGRSGRPGDLRGADLPGRGADLLQLRGRHPPGEHRRRRHADRRARGAARGAGSRGPAPEVHLLGAELPEPSRGDALRGAAPAPGRAGQGARAADRRGQPLRAAPLRRRSAADPLQPRRRGLRPLSRHPLEDPLARDPDRLGRGAAAGAREDRTGQAGGRSLHVDPQPVLRPRVLRGGPLALLHRRPDRDLPRPPRRDARSPRAPLPAAGGVDAPRREASSSGRPCPTTSTPRTCLRKPCARTSPSSRGAPPMPMGCAAPRRCASTSPPRARTSFERESGVSAESSPSRSRSTRRSPANTGSRLLRTRERSRGARSSRCRRR